MSYYFGQSLEHSICCLVCKDLFISKDHPPAHRLPRHYLKIRGSASASTQQCTHYFCGIWRPTQWPQLTVHFCSGGKTELSSNLKKGVRLSTLRRGGNIKSFYERASPLVFYTSGFFLFSKNICRIDLKYYKQLTVIPALVL